MSRRLARIRKICSACRVEQWAARGRRRCVRPVARGLRKNAPCWGQLVTIKREPKVRETPRPQEQAAVLAQLAQQKIAEHLTTIKRATTLIGKYQARAAYYSKRAAMTDAELAEEKAAREQRAKAKAKKTRAIAIEE
jgi:hypothetical protein